jgi:dienelactone hydrolase
MNLRFALLAALSSLTSSGADPARDFAGLRAQVVALGELMAPPAVHGAEAFAPAGSIKPLFFDGLPYQGKATRVFAWLGLPSERTGKVPGIVLVHGGGGTAFKEWVQQWNAHGFAALSIAVEGQTDERIPGAPPGAQWKRHPTGGPARQGIYGDAAEPLADQWMYHALADTILAHSLLRSLPEVDATRVGVSGISWGGVITSTVLGLDARFAFGIPIYGCGHLFDAANQYGRALGESALYREVWDPVRYLPRAQLPVLWLSWPEDAHFPLDCQAASYRAAPGPRLVALLPGMKHSHPAGWNPPDSYAFAASVVREGKPWCTQTRVTLQPDRAEIEFTSTKPLARATLISTTGSGFTGSRRWTESPARIRPQGDTWIVTTELPAGTTAWFVNARSGALTVSSDYQETNAAR